MQYDIFWFMNCVKVWRQPLINVCHPYPNTYNFCICISLGFIAILTLLKSAGSSWQQPLFTKQMIRFVFTKKTREPLFIKQIIWFVGHNALQWLKYTRFKVHKGTRMASILILWKLFVQWTWYRIRIPSLLLLVLFSVTYTSVPRPLWASFVNNFM